MLVALFKIILVLLGKTFNLTLKPFSLLNSSSIRFCIISTNKELWPTQTSKASFSLLLDTLYLSSTNE